MNIPFEIIKDAQGKNVMNLKSFEYNYDVIKYAQYHLENLYNGDKKLSKCEGNLKLIYPCIYFFK